MAERLFAAYFEQSRHTGHTSELVDIAVDIGLDADDVRAAAARDHAAAAEVSVMTGSQALRA